MQDRLDRGAVFRWPDPALRHRALETIEMVGKPEETALEHMHDVVDDVGPRKTPIGDGQHSLCDRDEAPPDIAGALGEARVLHASSPRHRQGPSHPKPLRMATVMPIVGTVQFRIHCSAPKPARKYQARPCAASRVPLSN